MLCFCFILTGSSLFPFCRRKAHSVKAREVFATFQLHCGCPDPILSWGSLWGSMEWVELHCRTDYRYYAFWAWNQDTINLYLIWNQTVEFVRVCVSALLHHTKYHSETGLQSLFILQLLLLILFFHIISPLQRWIIYSYTSPLSSFLALASCWYRGLKEGKYYKYWCYFLFNVWQCQLIPFLQYVHVRFVMVNISILPNFSGVCQLPQCYIPIFKLAVL